MNVDMIITGASAEVEPARQVKKTILIVFVQRLKSAGRFLAVDFKGDCS
jgi:hypothetical protein